MTKDTIHYGGIETDKIGGGFDAVTFFISDIKKENGERTDVWSLNFFTAPDDVTFQEKELGCKYTICVLNENLDVSIFEAILGDPVTYVNNCMRAREMGCVVKTSEWGSKLVELYQKIFTKGEIPNV